jgi:hypothetical protein
MIACLPPVDELDDVAGPLVDGELREIFDRLDHGLCIVEVQFDAAGRCVDYVFLDVNDAFERQTGLADATGRSMREMRPAHEEHWFDIYGAIARTGLPQRFSAPAARWDDGMTCMPFGSVLLGKIM